MTPSGTTLPPSEEIPTPDACDPLADLGTPITLANILGAGRHADGTLYVVDDGGRDHQRAFISNGDVLQRFIVAGSGSSGAENLTLSIASPEVTIRIDSPGPHPVRMGVVRGKLDDKTFEVGTTGDVLEIVDAEALAGLTVKNVPGNVVVEYNASLPDGLRLFVSRPEVDWTYEDFRVFFGTPDNMVERPLVHASRGNTTFLTFTVDGVDFQAVIPSAALGDRAPATLAYGTAPGITMTLLPTDVRARVGLRFVCTK